MMVVAVVFPRWDDLLVVVVLSCGPSSEAHIGGILVAVLVMFWWLSAGLPDVDEDDGAMQVRARCLETKWLPLIVSGRTSRVAGVTRTSEEKRACASGQAGPCYMRPWLAWSSFKSSETATKQGRPCEMLTRGAASCLRAPHRAYLILAQVGAWCHAMQGAVSCDFGPDHPCPGNSALGFQLAAKLLMRPGPARP